MAYNYSATQNNGKITSEHDYTTGEDVVYTYDSLNRLATAQTPGAGWGQSYAYDGFGNLTDITTTKGTTPEWHVGYSASTNRAGTDVADANGNIGNLGAAFDVENRMVMAPGSAGQYAYAPDNKRVWKKWNSGGALGMLEELAFWSVTGQRVAMYNLTVYSNTLTPVQTGCEYYFGGKLVKNANGYVHTDRLGSVGKYFPYGQERPSATANGTEKFATYFRDSDTGLDYADQRYHAPGQGRFLTPDPTMDNVEYSNPGSWNPYAYANGDPINMVDPDGTTACGDLTLASDRTVSDAVNANSGQGHFIDLVWHEAGVLSQANGNVGAWTAEFALIAQAIWDRYQLVQGKVQVTGANGVVYGGANVGALGYGAYGSTLNQVLINAAAGTNVLNSSGGLVDNASGLQADLNQDQGNFGYAPGRVSLVNGAGNTIWVTQGCYSVITAIESADGVAAGYNFNPAGQFITSWNSSPPQNNPNYAHGVEQFLDTAGPTNLYGFTNFTYGNFQRKPRPPTRPRPPGGPRQVQ
jgi:RHS repeat-associated protein